MNFYKNNLITLDFKVLKRINSMKQKIYKEI